MNQQRKCSSYAETASVGSTKSVRSNNSSSTGDHSHTLSKKGSLNGLLSRQGSQDSGGGGSNGAAGTTGSGSANWSSNIQNNNGSSGGSILNVAEMLLHGVADHEIFDIWLRSINCEEFIAKFIESGYDMPTLSRITPQDLAAIGVTEPAKRLKILTEIKKLNLQDGIPNFRPASLNHWLNLIKLDKFYYQSLCDQSIDSIDKMCQLTWEDFEELGITKLGHQKRIQLAIERVKGLEKEGDSVGGSLKTIAEPIYDTNPSQILLVASSENHSMNGPVINKQASSTSELSSTGSGSMHSVYSAASAHYSQSQLTPTPQPQQTTQPSQPQQTNPQQHQPQQQISQTPTNQAIHVNPMNQPTASPYHQQQTQMHFQNNQMQVTSLQPQQLQLQQQQQQQQLLQQQFQQQGIYSQPQTIYQQPNRQSLGQIPPQLIKLANLPKHQQQILQQSSIYATLGRHHPSKNKQPPPVPIRTNSLKSNSLTDDNYTMSNCKQTDQAPKFHNNTLGDQDHLSMLDQYYQHQSHVQSSHHFSANSPSSNISSGSNLTRHNTTTAGAKSHAVLTKNKSFSGNTHMEVSRARFLNRNSQQPQPNQPIAQLSAHPNNGLVHQQQQHQMQQLAAHQQQHQQHQQPQHNLNGVSITDTQCNFTTGKDDEFPPPPSPLSQTDLEASNDMVSSTSSDNFDRINHGLMAFRVGI